MSKTLESQAGLYPTSDGKPMVETDRHRELMIALLQTLQAIYAATPNVYVSGNLLIYYEPGNRRRHVAPDIFLVKGVAKHERPNYILWEEDRGPNLVIEFTSSSTRHEDTRRKFRLYQDVLGVREYFLFDPLGEYLDPPLRGYRLRAGKYAPIRPRRGRLPSKVLGLHLEKNGQELRLYDPTTEKWVLTPMEELAELRRRLGKS